MADAAHRSSAVMKMGERRPAFRSAVRLNDIRSGRDRSAVTRDVRLTPLDPPRPGLLEMRKAALR